MIGDDARRRKLRAFLNGLKSYQIDLKINFLFIRVFNKYQINLFK